MKPIYPLVALSLLSLALAGCGGSSSTATPAPGPATLSGTAAVGAALANATVTIRDNDPTTADRTATTFANGSYSVDVSGLAAPYVLRVVGAVAGVQHTLHSAATAADVNGTINITPLTDLIVANTAKTKASDCFANFTTVTGGSAPSATVTAVQLNAAEADLEASLRNILTADGVPADIDMLRTKFSANSTGLDLALDHLKVAAHPTIAGQSVVTYVGPSNAATGVAQGQQFMDTYASLGTNAIPVGAAYITVDIPTAFGGGTTALPAALILGTAATSGAPVLSGAVTVRDSDSTTADVTATTNATDGTYSVDVSSLKAPYMLEVKGGTVKGVALASPLYSAATATDAYGRINITPLTDAIVAKTTGKTAAAAFTATDGSDFSTIITGAKLNTAETAMQAALTTGMSGLSYMTSYAIPVDFDLMRTTFTAAGTSGAAALFGLVAVTVNANGSGTVTITPPTVNNFTPPKITINF